MPVGNARSRPSRHDLVLDDSIEKWAVPVGSLAGTRLSLSYTVFIAAAILLAVVLTVSKQPGNSDLPRVALLGTAFWVAGWLVQAATQFVLAGCLRLRLRSLSVGLIGVEGAARPWSAPRSGLMAVCTIGSLLVLGCLFRLVEGGFQMPVLSEAGETAWATPSIGLSTHDSLWRAGAWLCWVQAVFQMYPLPRSMGRQIVGSLAGLRAARLDLEMQVAVFRRCLTAVAILTIALSIYAMSLQDDSLLATNWSLLMLLGALLWASSRAADVDAILRRQLAAGDHVDDGEGDGSEPGFLARLRESIRRRQGDKRLKRVMEQERIEAVDAAKLDDILNQLHREGIDSLKAEDREILQRVSENLRKQRQVESDHPDGSG